MVTWRFEFTVCALCCVALRCTGVSMRAQRVPCATHHTPHGNIYMKFTTKRNGRLGETCRNVFFSPGRVWWGRVCFYMSARSPPPNDDSSKHTARARCVSSLPGLGLELGSNTRVGLVPVVIVRYCGPKAVVTHPISSILPSHQRKVTSEKSPALCSPPPWVSQRDFHG